MNPEVEATMLTILRHGDCCDECYQLQKKGGEQGIRDEVLDKVLERLQGLLLKPTEDAVLELMDEVDGFCSPHRNLRHPSTA